MMKKISLLTLFCILSISIFAWPAYPSITLQDDGIRTLVSGPNSIGGYGSISMNYSQIHDRDAFLGGFRGGIILGRSLSMGFFGEFFINDGEYNSELTRDVSLAGGYGGFFFEPIIKPENPVHVTFPIRVGIGGVTVISVNEDDWVSDMSSESADLFMIIEPGVELEMNVTRFFRFCIGLSYRYTNGIELQYPEEYRLTEDMLRGLSGGISLKFGKF